MYKVFWSSSLADPERLPRKAELMPTQFREFERALAYAEAINRSGGTAWLIEGNDGRRLGRHDIADGVSGERANTTPTPARAN
jgi:hypothetical protein